MKSSNLQIFKFPHPQIFKFPHPHILFILLLGLLSSCSPQRRLERLLFHYPELRIADTLLVRDTIITLPVVADTAFSIVRLTDTVTIARDRLEIKLFKVHDTIHVKGTCKADTIVREISVPVEKIKLVKAEVGWLGKLPWIILGLIVIAMLYKIGTRDAGPGTKS